MLVFLDPDTLRSFRGLSSSPPSIPPTFGPSLPELTTADFNLKLSFTRIDTCCLSACVVVAPERTLSSHAYLRFLDFPFTNCSSPLLRLDNSQLLCLDDTSAHLSPLTPTRLHISPVEQTSLARQAGYISTRDGCITCHERPG